MCRKVDFRILVLSLLLVIPLILGPTSSGYAGKPEPPTDAKITGKGLNGVLTAWVTTDMCDRKSVTGVIVAECADGSSFSIGPMLLCDTTAEGLAVATGEDLQNWYLPEAAPAGCITPGGGEDLVIHRVTGFWNSGTALGAEVYLQVLQY